MLLVGTDDDDDVVGGGRKGETRARVSTTDHPATTAHQQSHIRVDGGSGQTSEVTPAAAVAQQLYNRTRDHTHARAPQNTELVADEYADQVEQTKTTNSDDRPPPPTTERTKQKD